MALSTSKSYTIDMHAFKTLNNPSPSDDSNHDDLHSSLATLEILMTHRYRIQLQVRQTDDPDQRGDVLDVEHVASPVFISDRVAVPPHVLALRTLREACVAEVLGGFVAAEGDLCRGLTADIERFVEEVAAQFGFLGFAVVATVAVTTTDVVDHIVEQG